MSHAINVYERFRAQQSRPPASSFRAAFKDYESDIDWLYYQALHQKAEAIPGYLGSGRYYHVFTLPSDESLVGKIALRECEQLSSSDLPSIRRSSPDPYARVVESAAALLRGFGHDGLEQLVAYSDYTRTSVITRRAGEFTLKQLTDSGAIAHVPLRAYKSLIHTFIQLDNLLLDIDRVPQNILYAAGKFTVIDYLESWHKPPQTLYDRVVGFAGPRMLLSGLRESDAVPPYAKMYREASVEVLGEEWGRKIDALWLESGFELS